VNPTNRTVIARRGVVSSAFPAASEAGRDTLVAGGNAIDAAVAAAFALAVCEPSGSGLGGQTVMLVRLTGGRIFTIDGHSRAPEAVSKQTVSRAEQRAGHRSTTIPTTPATLGFAHHRYGRLPLTRLLQPALRLAEEGYPVTRLQSRQFGWCQAALAATRAGRRFLNGHRPYAPGEVFRQPRLAQALRRLADHGIDDFYSGDIARRIVADMKAHGGLLGATDLAAGPHVSERPTITMIYHGQEVITMPPPSGGVELLVALTVLEQLGAEADRGREMLWSVRLAEAVYAAFAERERNPAHPDTWPPTAAGPSCDQARAARIVEYLQQPVLAAAGADAEEPGETTHLCTADTDGNVVSLTQSVQSLFGAKVANPDYGFLYNNYLTTCPRRRHAYRLGSRSPTRSNAVPTFVLGRDSGWTLLALGAAGSRRIVSSVLHVISAVVDRGLTLPEAVCAPRVHPRLSRKVWAERPAATPEVSRELAAHFATVELRPRHSYTMGAVQALTVTAGGDMLATADPRRDGAAAGW
jgi:gamma-glutamyltranspeptidase/glutathione hydrolase